MKNSTSEQQKKGMDAWMKWMNANKTSIVEKKKPDVLVFLCPLWVISGHQSSDAIGPLCATSGLKTYQLTRMPALPPTPSMLSPKVTSSLANTLVLAEGLKKFTPAEISPHTSWRLCPGRSNGTASISFNRRGWALPRQCLASHRSPQPQLTFLF